MLVETVALARQHRRQIEAEPVDVHVLDPVFEAIDDQGANLRVLAIDGVAAAGEIFIVTLVLLHEAVVDRIVDAAQRKQRTQFIALGGVIEHNVQDHFDPRRVQRLDHGLEFRHGILHGVFVRGSEPCDRVVAPVIAQPALAQELFADEGLARQQLDRGHADGLQVLDHGCHREAQIFSAPLRRHRGVQLRKAFDMQLVDERIAPRNGGRPIVAPVEGVRRSTCERNGTERDSARAYGSIKAAVASKRWPFSGSLGPWTKYA